MKWPSYGARRCEAETKRRCAIRQGATMSLGNPYPQLQQLQYAKTKPKKKAEDWLLASLTLGDGAWKKQTGEEKREPW